MTGPSPYALSQREPSEPHSLIEATQYNHAGGYSESNDLDGDGYTDALERLAGLNQPANSSGSSSSNDSSGGEGHDFFGGNYYWGDDGVDPMYSSVLGKQLPPPPSLYKNPLDWIDPMYYSLLGELPPPPTLDDAVWGPVQSVPSEANPYVAAPAPTGNHIGYGESKYGYLDYGSSGSPNVQYSHAAAVQGVMDGRNGSASITASSGSIVRYDSDHRTSSITSQRSDGTYVTTTTHASGARSTSYSDSSGGSSSGKPIVLDLDGDGLEITELGRSTMFVDAAGDGLLHRSAWAGGGDGVLFYDPDGLGEIVEKNQYVFTEWDPTATSDLEALASIFDSNGDGVLDSGDDDFDLFKILVTNEDGSTTAQTLAALNITSIDLTADATHIELPDGSVIAGQTTYTKADGSTGTVGDMILQAEVMGYRIEQVESTDGNGTRTETSTAYDADGLIAYQITSVTSSTGDSVTNSYDDNGDGVVDRLQTIDTITLPGGETEETEHNYRGSDYATAVLVASKVVTTSVDGKTITIERDSTGGGWFDQREVRITHLDDSLTITVSDLAQDGTVIRSSSETVSADGLTRTENIDADGNGAADTTVTHDVVVHVDDSRTETISTTNGDGSLRSEVVEDVSADGRSKTVERDLDGDGLADVTEDLTIVVNAGGDTDSTLTVENRDGSVRSTTTTHQSDDALTRTIHTDLDGDGNDDMIVVDATTINPDTSRERVVTTTNQDGSIRQMTKETLGADKVTSESWNDLNQNGIFEATDLVRSVTVDGVTGERTSQDFDRNADGTVRAKTTITTSQDGLIQTIAIDSDGDGDVDTQIVETTSVDGLGVATTDRQVKNQNLSLRSSSTVETSADGLTVTREQDIDGDGTIDAKTVDATIVQVDDSIIQTISNYAGDGTTLLSEQVITESADRRTMETRTDSDGNGVDNVVVSSVQGADGSWTHTTTSYNADGSEVGQSVTTVSANGLVSTTSNDLDGDLVADELISETTVLNNDGSRTITVSVTNADGSLRSRTITTISDDDLETTVQTDSNGDGTYEQVVTTTSVLNADGSTTTTRETRAADNSLISSEIVETSDNGLTVTTSADRDGDGTIDLVSESQTTLLVDGGRQTIVDVEDGSGILRSRETTNVSDNGRVITTSSDLDGDGLVDQTTTRTIADDGTVEEVITRLNADGSVQSQQTVTSSDDGLIRTTESDPYGQGTAKLELVEQTVMNADGSRTQTVEQKDESGIVHARSVTDVSDVGLSVTVKSDADNDGTFERTVTTVETIATDGVETSTTQTLAGDNSLLSSEVTTISADGRTITSEVDADGDGNKDRDRVTAIQANGGVQTTSSYWAAAGGLLASMSEFTSDDGLEFNWSVDRDGDGTDELFSESITTLANDGSTSRVVSHEDGQNNVLASESHTRSDDGLHQESNFDFDGDGLFDFKTVDDTVLGANGDVTRTLTTKDASDTTISTASIVISGDGLTRTQNTDLTGDGVDETTSLHVEGADGGWTRTSQQFDGSGSLVRSTIVTVAADQRSGSTMVDLDGDGLNDRSVSWSLNNDDLNTSIYSDLNDTGSATSIITGEVSANGSGITYTFDIDGDLTDDFVRETVVSYDSSGNQITDFSESYGNGILNHSYVTTKSADGLTSTTVIDEDGDGSTDATSTYSMDLNDDGSTSAVSETTYADGSLRSRSTETVTADQRLIIRREDFTGDGKDNRQTITELKDDGSTVETVTSYLSDRLSFEYYQSTGWISELANVPWSSPSVVGTIDDFDPATMDADLGGNGNYYAVRYKGTLTVETAGQYWFETGSDDGSQLFVDGQLVVDNDGLHGVEYQNGTITLAAGEHEFEVQFFQGYSGDFLSVKVNGPDTNSTAVNLLQSSLPNGVEANTIVTTTSVDGLTSTISRLDKDVGPGPALQYDYFAFDFNPSTVDQIPTFNPDKSGYVNDLDVSNLDANSGGDGNDYGIRYSGFLDIETGGSYDFEIGSDDGSRLLINGQLVINNDYDHGMEYKSGSVSLTAGLNSIEILFYEDGGSDNLELTISGADTNSTVKSLFDTDLVLPAVEAITRSSINDGSYVWDSGLSDDMRHVVRHEVDAAGIDTWSYERTEVGSIQSYEARFDATTKAVFLSQAADIYDSVLDRDMTFDEFEILVEFTTTGSQLDQAALVDALLTSDEYAARYGSTTDAQFVGQSFLNAFGRAPSMAEMGDYLDALNQGELSRSELIVKLAESAEHQVVGNSHRSTNNFDLELNPAEFERSLDKAYVEKLIVDLFDTLRDRQPTNSELSGYSDDLLSGSDMLKDVAQDLLSENDLQNNPYLDTTNKQLIELAFANTLDRAPTVTEQQEWLYRLNSQQMSQAEFVVAMSQSVEHQSLLESSYNGPAVGRANEVEVQGTNSVDYLYADTSGNLSGTSVGADHRIFGKDGDDWIGGDAEYDLLDSAKGGDDYIDGGSGHDFITGDAETDLLDSSVGGDDYIKGGSGNDDIIGDAGWDLMNSSIGGNDYLDGGSGTDILAGDAYYDLRGSAVGGNDLLFGGSGGDYLSGDADRHMKDNSQGGDDYLHGGDGDDEIYGDAYAKMRHNSVGGDDVIIGGAGDDFLVGDGYIMLDNSVGGDDTFVFNFNDGNFGHDIIDDFEAGANTNDVMEFEGVTGINSFADVLSMATDDGTDTTITVDNDNSIELRNVLTSELSADDFRFL
ncbi:MAG: PA14 domain-containing protein [Rhizobiaceae bacterium]